LFRFFLGLAAARLLSRSPADLSGWSSEMDPGDAAASGNANARANRRAAPQADPRSLGLPCTLIRSVGATASRRLWHFKPKVFSRPKPDSSVALGR